MAFDKKPDHFDKRQAMISKNQSKELNMGGIGSSRWPKGFTRRPYVDEVWVLDSERFMPFSGEGSKTVHCVVDMERQTPFGSIQVEFLLQDRWLRVFLWRPLGQTKVFVTQKLRVVWIARGELQVPQLGFICPHCGGRFFKLYMGDGKYNSEQFCCRKGYGFTYASQCMPRPEN